MLKVKRIFSLLSLSTIALIGAPPEVSLTQETSRVDAFDPDKICKALEKDFYVSIPHEVPHSVITDTIEAFLAFLETDQAVKDHLQSQLPGNHRRRELGFTHRKAINQNYEDTKDLFHYHPFLKKSHEEYISTHPIANRLITQTDVIWNYVADTTKKILTCLNSKYPGLYNKIFDTEEPHIVLRLVHYQVDQKQEIWAKPHFDAGSFTLAIAESVPGLRIGSHQENLQLVPHQEGRAIFMLGANCRQLITTETLLPGWHDVIRLDNLPSRWAIVAFIDGHGLEGLSRNDSRNPGGNSEFIPNRQ